ncbi:MAG: hypothetical protein LUQ66_06000 [Methanoregula sp.]|nr:hypothetical protein [Methanoregula sp.]
MIIFDTATLVLVYSIAGKLWGRDKAFLCGLLYATAFSAAFFIPITYDAFPSFLLLLSIWIYLYRSESTGFLLATAGALTKWYPGLSLPYFLLHGFKTGKMWGHFRRSIILSGILVSLTLIPFILLNARGFISTYTSHFDRDAEVNSSIYYLDTICNFFLNLEPFDTLSILLVIIIELALLYWYYRHLDSTPQALLGCIFLSIFIFVIFNKVFSTYYLIWFLPFLSLFLIKSSRHILLFYAVQAIMYLETPVLFGIVYAPFNAFYPEFDSATNYSVLTGSLPSLPFIFYTLKFGIFLLVLLVIVRDLNHDHSLSGPRAHLTT